MLLLRTDLGKWGLTIGVAIHAQIYALLFVLQWCSLQVKTLVEKMEILKCACAGNYEAVELIPGNATQDSIPAENSQL